MIFISKMGEKINGIEMFHNLTSLHSKDRVASTRRPSIEEHTTMLHQVDESKVEGNARFELANTEDNIINESQGTLAFQAKDFLRRRIGFRERGMKNTHSSVIIGLSNGRIEVEGWDRSGCNYLMTNEQQNLRTPFCQAKIITNKSQ